MKTSWVLAGGMVLLLAVVGVLALQLSDARTRLAALEARSSTAAPLQPGVAPTRARGAVDDDVNGDEPGVPAKAFRTTSPSAAVAVGTQQALPSAASAPAAPSAPSTELQNVVRAELERAEAEREAVRSERIRARTIERVNALDEALAQQRLSAPQREQLVEMLDAETQEVRVLFREGRDGGDFMAVREQVRALRQKTDDNAKALLNEEQHAAYDAMREQERARFMASERTR